MKDRARDAYEHVWKRIKPELGHLYIEQVTTSALDAFKRTLPKHVGPRSINHYLVLIRAVLGFLWKRGKLASLPHVPKESVPRKHVEWYTRKERDQLLEGLYRLEPQWYLFFYKTRAARLDTRKTDEAYALDITADILHAVDWHLEQGYGGPEFLFSKAGAFPRYIDSHVRPLKLVQQKLGLRMLSHHKFGRHSVASQAVTGGESVKAVQAQLGHRSEQSTHKYAHLGSGAQRRLMEGLKPAAAPHELAARTPTTSGNVASTDEAQATSADAHVNLASTPSTPAPQAAE